MASDQRKQGPFEDLHGSHKCGAGRSEGGRTQVVSAEGLHQGWVLSQPFPVLSRFLLFPPLSPFPPLTEHPFSENSARCRLKHLVSAIVMAKMHAIDPTVKIVLAGERAQHLRVPAATKAGDMCSTPETICGRSELACYWLPSDLHKLSTTRL